MDIFTNFITNKKKHFTGSDPTWMNDDIENKVKLKHNLYHHYIRHQRNKVDFSKLEDLRSEIDNLMSKSKKEYYHNINRKLNDPSANSKTFWLIMKNFFNG